jgi:hypothetical protein
LSVCPSFRPSVCLSQCPSVRPSLHLSVCLSIRPSVCLLSVRLSVRPSVCLSSQNLSLGRRRPKKEEFFVQIAGRMKEPPTFVPRERPLQQARTGRGIHGLPKVSPWPAMPNPYTPCGRLLPPWIPLPVRACPYSMVEGGVLPSD